MGEVSASSRRLDVSDLRSAGGTLLDRCELKYLLSEGQLAGVLNVLEKIGAVIHVNGSALCRYDTCYFDTGDGQSLRDAQRGAIPRWKIRCREYRQSGERFLEVKSVAAEGVFKQRTAHAASSLELLSEQDVAFLSTVSELACIRPEVLSPVAVTSYDRLTFLVDGTRVTVDTALQCRIGGAVLSAPGAVIVETKRPIGSPASFIDRELLSQGVHPGAFSKFADAGTFLMTGRLAPGAVPWART